MSQLLIQEPPLQVLPSLAVQIGLNEAIVVQQVHYWLLRATIYHDSRKWVYKTIKEWQEEFPFWSEDTILRTLKKLKESGILIAKQMGKNKFDKTLFYTIEYSNIPSSIPANCDHGDMQDASISIYTEITTETTTDKATQAKPAKSPEITFDKFIEQRKSEGLSAIEETDPVWDVIDSLNMPDEFAVLQWRYLESQYSVKQNGKAKRYKQWPLVLKKALAELWGQLFFKSENGWVLTSKGKNLKELAE